MPQTNKMAPWPQWPADGLYGVPEEMLEWNMEFLQAEHDPNLGGVRVVAIEKSDVELQHQVDVVYRLPGQGPGGQDGFAGLPGATVLFLLPGNNSGNLNYLKPNGKNAMSHLAVLSGSGVVTGPSGRATHTVGGGGEHILVYYRAYNPVSRKWEIWLKSDEVKNCTRQVDINQHTCVRITFEVQINPEALFAQNELP